MPAINALALTDATNYALTFYVRGGMLYQTNQDKPLLKFLEAGKKNFPGGKDYVSEPVKGSVMNDTSGFFAGVTLNSELAFTQMATGLRAQYAWKMQHAGLVIDFQTLLKDGISVVDGEQRTSEHSQTDLIRITGLLQDAIEDYGESWSRARNLMLWQDGTQDSNQVPGVKSLILDDPTVGTVGGLSQATYSWWRSRANLALVASPENQTLSIFFRNEVIQLRKRGGRPNKMLVGSLFWDGLSKEVEKKGIYTQSGFANKNNDIGMQTISLTGVGEFEYDPTLDDIGEAKSCYVFDSRRIKLRPIEGEHNKMLEPARPYDYLVMLKSMTDASALEATQLNAMGKYALA